MGAHSAVATPVATAPWPEPGQAPGASRCAAVARVEAPAPRRRFRAHPLASAGQARRGGALHPRGDGRLDVRSAGPALGLGALGAGAPHRRRGDARALSRDPVLGDASGTAEEDHEALPRLERSRARGDAHPHPGDRRLASLRRLERHDGGWLRPLDPSRPGPAAHPSRRGACLALLGAAPPARGRRLRRGAHGLRHAVRGGAAAARGREPLAPARARRESRCWWRRSTAGGLAHRPGQRQAARRGRSRRRHHLGRRGSGRPPRRRHRLCGRQGVVPRCGLAGHPADHRPAGAARRHRLRCEEPPLLGGRHRGQPPLRPDACRGRQGLARGRRIAARARPHAGRAPARQPRDDRRRLDLRHDEPAAEAHQAHQARRRGESGPDGLTRAAARARPHRGEPRRQAGLAAA